MFVLLLFSLFLLCPMNFLVEGVNLAKYGNLTNDEFLELDREVTEFFNENYETLDSKNASYDDTLFKSIRALRHTVVMNHYDFRYTDENIMRNSQGSDVDDKLCLEQLQILVEFTRLRHEATTKALPLTVTNFLDSYGKTEAGALNGNILWMGSYATCQRAYIPSSVIKSLQTIENKSNISQLAKEKNLNGRFCYSHLRGRDWTKNDKYFENRINIKVGVCLPKTCHSYLYFQSEEMRNYIDYLGRSHLSDPFNTDRYVIDYLYCFPDEDSKFRQWDLGTKLFIGFILCWTLILFYTNLKYNQRLETMQRLRESVDIRMIIRQKRNSSATQNRSDTDDKQQASHIKDANKNIQQQEKSPAVTPTIRKKLLDTLTSSSTTTTMTNEPTTSTNSVSRASSTQATPIQSENDDDNEGAGGDISVVRCIGGSSSTGRKSRKISSSSLSNKEIARKEPSSGSSKGIDFIAAFSIQANLDYLLRTREKTKSDNKQEGSNYESKNTSTNNPVTSGLNTATAKRLSQQLSATHRRISASNESLFNDLQNNELIEDDSHKKGSHSHSSSRMENERANRGSKQFDLTGKSGETLLSSKKPVSSKTGRRVNLDILDGIKVLATAWIVYGHTLMFFFGIVTDLRFGDERMFDLTMLTALNTLHVVSLFYIITGLLLTYLAFSRQKKSQLLKPGFWILVFVGRYIRLLPVYFLVFWFARHVSPYLGSGVLWFDYRTDQEHVRGQCAHESWWVMLTMSAVDIKIPFDCVPQSWYLSNDTRTLFVLPIYIIILAINQKAGYAAIISTFIFSYARLTQILRVANIDYTVVIYWKPHVYSILADRLHDVYTDLTVRLSTYLIGVLAGHLIYRYEIGDIKNWPRWFRLIGMKVALLVAVMFFMGAVVIKQPIVHQFLPPPHDIDSDMVVNLIPLFKGAMEICLAIVLVLMITGGGYKIINQALSGNYAKILSNISYGVFLIHVELMYKIEAYKFESNYWALFINSGFFVFTSNILAFFLHILYEMPINNLMRHVTRKLYKMTVK